VLILINLAVNQQIAPTLWCHFECFGVAIAESKMYREVWVMNRPAKFIDTPFAFAIATEKRLLEVTLTYYRPLSVGQINAGLN